MCLPNSSGRPRRTRPPRVPSAGHVGRRQHRGQSGGDALPVGGGDRQFAREGVPTLVRGTHRARRRGTRGWTEGPPPDRSAFSLRGPIPRGARAEGTRASLTRALVEFPATMIDASGGSLNLGLQAAPGPGGPAALPGGPAALTGGPAAAASHRCGTTRRRACR